MIGLPSYSPLSTICTGWNSRLPRNSRLRFWSTRASSVPISSGLCFCSMVLRLFSRWSPSPERRAAPSLTCADRVPRSAGRPRRYGVQSLQDLGDEVRVAARSGRQASWSWWSCGTSRSAPPTPPSAATPRRHSIDTGFPQELAARTSESCLPPSRSVTSARSPCCSRPATSPCAARRLAPGGPCTAWATPTAKLGTAWPRACWCASPPSRPAARRRSGGGGLRRPVRGHSAPVAHQEPHDGASRAATTIVKGSLGVGIARPCVGGWKEGGGQVPRCVPLQTPRSSLVLLMPLFKRAAQMQKRSAIGHRRLRSQLPVPNVPNLRR